MKKTVRMFSLLLALILGLYVCCAGFAEEAAAIDEKAAMEFFVTMMQLVPGMEGIDWEAFVKEYDEKKASGAEITLEDCLPKEAWNAYSALMFMDENGNIPTEDELGFSIETIVNGNEMTSLYTMKEQVNEENAKAMAETIAASFESDETKQNMLESFKQMDAGEINASTVKMTLKFVNADGSVIYEKTYTYEELAKELEPAA